MIDLKFNHSKSTDFCCENRELIQKLVKESSFAHYIFNGEVKSTKPEHFITLPTNTILIQFIPNSHQFVLKRNDGKEFVCTESSADGVKSRFNHFYCERVVRKFLAVKFEPKFPTATDCDFKELPLLTADVDQKQALNFIVDECCKKPKELNYFITQLSVLVDLLKKTSDVLIRKKALEIISSSAFECPAAWFNDVIEAQKILLGTADQELKTFIHGIKEHLADAVIAETVLRDLSAHGKKVTSQTRHAAVHLKQLLYKQGIYVSHTDLLQFKDNASHRKDFGIHGDVKTVTSWFFESFAALFVFEVAERLNRAFAQNNELMKLVKRTLQESHTDCQQERLCLAVYNDGLIEKISADGVLQLLDNLSLD